MTLNFQVLGQPQRDNAVFVSIDTGQRVDRLLFDCGANCLDSLSVSEIQSVDHLFFSHFHMDHISGFDTFFRLTYDREKTVWGPPGAGQVIGHRFRGFLWNMYEHLQSKWYVNDIHSDYVEGVRFDANEAFIRAHHLETSGFNAVLIDTADYRVEAYTMNHNTPSIAYVVREKPRLNVDTTKLTAMGMRPGSWLKQVKDLYVDEMLSVDVNGQSYTVGELRQHLLVETPGQSLSYLTDFLMDATTQERLVEVLQGCTYIICESQYRAVDLELAQRNYHMTSTQVAEAAKKANVQELILFHISDRYEKEDCFQLLDEACVIFPNTRFPVGWTF